MIILLLALHRQRDDGVDSLQFEQSQLKQYIHTEGKKCRILRRRVSLCYFANECQKLLLLAAIAIPNTAVNV